MKAIYFPTIIGKAEKCTFISIVRPKNNRTGLHHGPVFLLSPTIEHLMRTQLPRGGSEYILNPQHRPIYRKGNDGRLCKATEK